MLKITRKSYGDGKWKAILSNGQIVFIEGANESDEEMILKSFQSLVYAKNNKPNMNETINFIKYTI